MTNALDRVRRGVAECLRRAGDAAHHAANRLVPGDEPATQPTPKPAPIALVCNALAAMASLPKPPGTTGDLETDVENLRLYQTALAEHAKRDEQLRALGALAARLAPAIR
ncbi:MAG: hypothetical protein HS111_06830 [Kofleriaceae bacterium]|nr:hypothetical protein [Kofleriaceae bacterium]MCL4225578.1 hypothetical protein [Myxococcales bacterium]